MTLHTWRPLSMRGCRLFLLLALRRWEHLQQREGLEAPEVNEQGEQTQAGTAQNNSREKGMAAAAAAAAAWQQQAGLSRASSAPAGCLPCP